MSIKVIKNLRNNFHSLNSTRIVDNLFWLFNVLMFFHLLKSLYFSLFSFVIIWIEVKKKKKKSGIFKSHWVIFKYFSNSSIAIYVWIILSLFNNIKLILKYKWMWKKRGEKNNEKFSQNIHINHICLNGKLVKNFWIWKFSIVKKFNFKFIIHWQVYLFIFSMKI